MQNTQQSVDAIVASASVEIMRDLLPQGFDTADDAPGTLEACTEYFRKHGTVCVSNYFGPDVIMGRPEEQHAFAAWHDYCHVKLSASFDPPGEKRVQRCMVQHLAAWRAKHPERCNAAEFRRAAAVLAANNIGRLDYWTRHGDAPADARMFTEGYLAAKGVL